MYFALAEEKHRAKLALLEASFTTEQILAMEFVAEQAVKRALEQHSEECPFEKRIQATAWKGMLLFLAFIATGAYFAFNMVRTHFETHK